ncbi:MAG: tetratricopeptide repeat protein [Crocinitomicaceae bacterium]|nr:tetratricopeptide repeat protein [Crocinitomicaceae bacterium]
MLLKQAVDLFKKLLGEDHPEVAKSIKKLALLYNNQGRYEEAKNLYL